MKLKIEKIFNENMVLSCKPTWLNPFCSILTIGLTSGRKKTTAAHKTFCENNYIEILFAKEDEQDKKARN